MLSIIIAAIAVVAAATMEHNHRQSTADLTSMIGRIIEAHEAGV